MLTRRFGAEQGASTTLRPSSGMPNGRVRTGCRRSFSNQIRPQPADGARLVAARNPNSLHKPLPSKRLGAFRLDVVGSAMRGSPPFGRLGERPDRPNLVLWLAANGAHDSDFLFRALADLIERGFLSEAQKKAARRCRSRVLIQRARLWLSPRRRNSGR